MVFAADHGETFGEHGVHGHARNVLTPVVWVPLVLRFPFAVDPSVRIASQVRNVDIAPTLLELAGIPIPDGFEGSSLVPLLTGAVSEPDRPNYAGLGVPLFPDASVQTAVSDGNWTYARNATAAADDEAAYEDRAVAPGAEYLFDRRVDPGENVNLVARETAEAERLRELLDAYLAAGDAGVVEEGVRIDPGIAGRLRAMGYLR
jgi:arylsulfatase A-like enzyme